MHRKSELLVVYLFLGLIALVYGLVLLLGPMASLGWAAPLRQSMPDLAVTKYKDSGIFAPGHLVKYVIFYQNISLYPATDIFIRDTLPISTTYVSSSGPGLTLVQAGPDRVVWYKVRLADFESGWASITVRVDDDAPVDAWLPNTVSISCLDLESRRDNNEYTLHETVRPVEPDLTVTKKLYAGTVAPGNEITYQIIYHNDGGSTANNVRITDTLPISTTYVSDDTSDSNGFTTVITGSTVVWTRSEVPPMSWCRLCPKPEDGTKELYLRVRISDDFDPNADWLENVVEISTSDVEADYDNNLNRLIVKPEAHRLYGAAVTSVDDKTMQLLSAGGFDWMIYYLNWSETEPLDNRYYWRDLDSAAWQAWWYNLKLIVRVDRAPAWARGPGTVTAPPSDPNDLRNFLQAVAGRWPHRPSRPNSPRIHGYITWNEPNLASEWGGNAPDAADYTTLLQAAYNGVKAADPNAWVISAGLAPTNDNSATAVDDRIFLQDMLTNSACNYFDRLGVNPMGFASAPDDTSDPNDYSFSRTLEWRQIMVDDGCSKDMFATEMGWLRDTPIDLGSYNWMKVSDIDQAHYLARAYHKARREWPWIGPMMTWNLDFATFYEDTEHFHWFSVTEDGLSPLRPYLTLKNAATGGPADLWMEKELVSLDAPGGDLVYLIHYTNIGGQPATGVLLTDILPNHTTYVTDSIGGTLVGDDQVVWDIGTVDTGAREAITLTLHLSETVPLGAVLTNTVEAGVVAAEPYTDDNVASAVITSPMTVDDTYTTIEGAPPLTITAPGVLGNDIGSNGDPLTAVKDSDPTTGTLTLSADGSFVYTPTLGFTGLVTFTYHAQKGTKDLNIATVTITVRAAADLIISKLSEPLFVMPGWDTVTYTVAVRNPGPSDANGAIVSDTVPAGISDFNWSCVAAAGASCGVASGTGDVNQAVDLPEGSVVTYTITGMVSSSATSDLVNTASVTVPVGVLELNPADNTTTTITSLAISIDKTADPNTDVTYHGEVTYTVVLRNDGVSDGSGFLLTDTLPGEVDFARWVEQPGGANVSNDEITWGGTVTVGEAITFTFVVSHVGGYGDVVTNTAYYSHTFGGSGDDDATFTVNDPPSLSIAKTVDPDTDVAYHGEVTYTVVLSNTGPSDAHNVLLTDTLSSEVDFSRWVEQSGASESNDETTWSGTVTAGEAITFTFVVSHVGDYGDVVTNTAEYSYTLGSGYDEATFTVNGPPDLSIGKTASPDTGVTYHGEVTYTVVLSNSGPSDAISTLFTDTLPGEVDFDHWVVQNGANEAGDEITWSGTVTAGEAITFAFVVSHVGDYSDAVSNTAEYSYTLGSGDDEATFTVNGPPDLSIGKTASPDTAVTYHGEVTYTVVLSNSGPSDAISTLFTDTLPGEVDFDHWVVQNGANEAGDETTWSGTVTAGEAITFSFVVSHVGDYSDAVSNTAEYSHLHIDNSDDAAFSVLGPPDLSIDKTVTPATGVTYHGEVTYTVVLSNSGPSDAISTLFTDTLPGEVDFDHWVVQNGANEAGDEITWSGTVTAGEAITFTFVVSHVGDYSDVVTNTAEYSHTISGSGYDEATFTVNGPPDLSIGKTASPDTAVTYHGEVAYTVVLSNSGPSNANGVLLTDTLPSEVDFGRWVVQSGASESNDEITWTGAVTAGEAITFTFVVSHMGDYSDVVSNTAEYSYTLGSGDDEATFTVESTLPTYAPLVMKGFVYAPDLVVDSLVATSNAVTVTIKNQGNAAVTDDFWVDVYFNPRVTPSLNQPWDTIASHGAAWGVTAFISANGGSLTLTTGGDYYVPEYSSTPPLPVGADVYALVDSVDFSTTYGAVWESNEGNNLSGPVTSTAGVGGQKAPAVGRGQSASRKGLPPR